MPERVVHEWRSYGERYRIVESVLRPGEFCTQFHEFNPLTGEWVPHDVRGSCSALMGEIRNLVYRLHEGEKYDMTWSKLVETPLLQTLIDASPPIPVSRWERIRWAVYGKWARRFLDWLRREWL